MYASEAGVSGFRREAAQPAQEAYNPNPGRRELVLRRNKSSTY